MADIRVDPAQLRKAASEIEAAAARIRAMADEALGSAANSPQYGGQFKPRAMDLAFQAHARLNTQADRFTALSEHLMERAAAFEQADRESQAALAALGARLPLASIRVSPGFQIIPDWIWELLIGFLPFGDLYDIGKELIRLIIQGEADELVLALAALGLIADLGWLDGPIPDPVDAANGGLALLKALVKQIPPGPARDAIKEAVQGLIRNADEAPRFFEALFGLLKQEEVFTALQENHRALAAVIEAGPEVMEVLAKNGEAAQALIRHQDVAISLIKRTEYLDEVIQGGPEAVEQLLKYGDDFAARFVDDIPDNGLANLGVLRGMEVNKLGQELGLDIHIAGRWADTPADVEVRRLAAAEVDDLIESQNISRIEAQLRVAQKYDIDFYQARVSSGKPEVDVFIPQEQWRLLSDSQKDEIAARFADIFDVDIADVGFYQELKPLDLGELGMPAGKYAVPDPATNMPPGSIRFGRDGAMEHPALRNIGASGQ